MTMHRNSLVAVLIACLFAAVAPAALAADDYQDAARLLKEGKRTEAMERVDAFLAQHPRDARARFLKGVILSEQNKPTDAIKQFTDLTQDYPELPEPYNNLAVLYAGQGDYEKARKALEMAIRTHPSYAVAHENLGDIYATLASQAYDRALQLDSSNAAARKKLSLIKELFPPKAGTTLAKAEGEPMEKAAPVAPPPPRAPDQPPASVRPPDQPVAVPKGPSAVAPKPTEAPPPATAPNNGNSSADEAAVLQTLHGWTKAWSTNDAERYLGYYAREFQPPSGESRQSWEAGRRARLAKPKKIHVTASSPRVRFTDNNHAVVTFRQSYSSDSLKASGNKTMRLVRVGDRWLIEQETIEK